MAYRGLLHLRSRTGRLRLAVCWQILWGAVLIYRILMVPDWAYPAVLTTTFTCRC